MPSGLHDAVALDAGEDRTLLDALPHIAWVMDPAGAVYWHNRRWLQFTGAGAEASRGCAWLKVVHPDHADRVEQHFRTAVATGEEWEDTFPMRRADGAYRWFLSRAIPIRDAANTIERWCGTHTDITERVRIEHGLGEAARRKDALLAWLGHELRNPITPILTAARLLTIVGPSDPALQTARETIVRQALQLSNLVDDLLDAGRLSFGKLRLRPKTVELAPLIAQAIEACQGEVARRRHRLDVNLASRPVWLDADSTRVVQMVSNLLSNACKYMRDGGVIEVTTAVDDQHALIRVRDEGIGIAADVVSRVFDAYVQVGVGPLHAQGLGIGLALVKAIAEAHGGTVGVRSEGLDRGSEFTIRLPLKRSP